MSRFASALLVTTTLASVATLVTTWVEGRAREGRIAALEAEVRAIGEAADAPARPREGIDERRVAPPEATLSAADLQAIADLCAVAVSSSAPAPAADDPASPPDPEARAEQARARVDADTLFDEAADRGRWTEDDRRALHEILGRLSREDGEAMTRRLAQMLNEGELALDADAPL
jgi:hypothetical protein